MAHALVGSVSGFVAARAVLGAAESIGTPAQVKTAAVYFPPEKRSFMIGIGNMASNIGAVVAPLAIPPLAFWLGWRAAFLVTGGLGLVWVVLWLIVAPATPEAETISKVALPWRALLGDRRQWALVAAKMFSDNVWWFLLFFSPDLFHRMFGLSQGTLGLPVAFIYAMAALGALFGGWLPSRLMAGGRQSGPRAKGFDAALRAAHPAGPAAAAARAQRLGGGGAARAGAFRAPGLFDQRLRDGGGHVPRRGSWAARSASPRSPGISPGWR